MEWMPTPFLLENVPEKAEVQQIQIEFTGIAWSFSAREYVFYVVFFNFRKMSLAMFSPQSYRNEFTTSLWFTLALLWFN